jgi:hypothetical protein
MGNKPTRTAAPIVAALALLLLPLGAVYVGGYYWLGFYYPNSLVIGTRTISVRSFPYVWQQKLYVPAAKLESFLSKSEVQAGCYYYGAGEDDWMYESP